MKTVNMYTDGACSGNQNEENVGGWGCILEFAGREKELWDGEVNTTNNRMELCAPIAGFSALKEKGLRNIQEYNVIADDKLPCYVVIIDEYGDLILQGTKEMEVAICRIAQKARAVGIHMIISTQRPDTKIVTGSIKANFPTRIAFRTTTGTDSRVILDHIGAERLTGKGDMLFFNGGESTRVQCAYTSTEDVISMCEEMKDEYDNCVPTMLPAKPVNPVQSVMQGKWTTNKYGNMVYETAYGLKFVL